MKPANLLGILLLLSFPLSAQLRLNIAGDAKISGHLELGNNRNNLILGYLAGINTTGNWNTFIGTSSGNANTSGSQNTFYGNNSGRSNIDGGTNTFIGYFAGFNSNSFGNTFVGNDAGLSNTDGIWNAYLGSLAGRSSTGSYNTFIGKSAGFDNGSGSANTFIGHDAGNPDQDTPFNKAIAIGHEAKVACSNCAAIGGTGDNAVLVGIGTSTPFRTLDVHGEAIFRDENGIVTFQSSGSNAFFGFENNGNTAGANVGYFNNNSEAFYYIDHPGGVFGEMIVEDNGDIYQNGSLIHSDRRFKRAIRPIQRAIEKIRQLKGVSYAFKKQEGEKRNASEDRHLGVIAQEVAPILPELVKDRPDGYKAVNYDGFIPLLIEGMKEQQDKIEDQEQQIEALQAKVSTLSALVEQLLTHQQNEQKVPSHSIQLKQAPMLAQNRPNPLHQQTMIDYFIPADVQDAKMQITNVAGQLIYTVEINETGAGQVIIEAKAYPAGTYYYSLVLDGQVFDTKAMVLSAN